MNQKHLLGSVATVFFLAACAAAEDSPADNKAETVARGAEQDETSQTPPNEMTTDVADESEAAALDYVGSWHMFNASGGVEWFMVLQAEEGAVCVSDGKSQAHFDLVSEGGKLTMGDYDYGGGDLIEVIEEGTMLRRTAEEKGVTYVDTYERWDAALPGWCIEQLAE
jgi:hypothetical protein